jgi:uncharacterized protein
MLQRKAVNELLKWKRKSRKKPLIIRGARQVGKSTTVDMLGSHYKSYVRLNLEKSSDARFFTSYGDDIPKIINAIALEHNVLLSKGDFLLFIDEIQEVPQAISLLRYFYEGDYGVDVIAAGSLLEFALGEVPSIPVGRVELFYMYPLDFEEFLMALGEETLLDIFRSIPIPDYAHHKLLNLFNEYTIVGGMPEIVSTYIENTRNISMIYTTYGSIWDNYTLDVEKYSKSTNERRVIHHIMLTASTVRDRITYHGFGHSYFSSREVSEALKKLQMAGVFTLIHPTNDVIAPLTPNYKRKPKLQFLDTGLLNYAAKLHVELLSLKDLNQAYRGFILNHIVFQEILCSSSVRATMAMFWTRENTNANAEVDIIMQYKNLAIPFEVKSGAKGSLKSLHEFMERCDHKYGFRLLANEFSVERSKTRSGKEFYIINLPYYCCGRLVEWVSYIVDNYK